MKLDKNTSLNLLTSLKIVKLLLKMHKRNKERFVIKTSNGEIYHCTEIQAITEMTKYDILCEVAVCMH